MLKTDIPGSADRNSEEGAGVRLRRHLKRHLACNENRYLFLTVALAAGVLAGAITAGCLNGSLREEMTVILENYRTVLRNGGLTALSSVLPDTVSAALRPMLLLTLCGFSVFAEPAGLLCLSAKGFALGFFTATAVTCLPVRVCLWILLPSVPYQLLASFLLLAAAGVAGAHRSMGESTAVYLAQSAVLCACLTGAVLLDLLLKAGLWRAAG